MSDTVFLMAVASLGVTLNALVAASLLTMPAAGHRRSTASFVVHACLLDGVKCVYCVPLAVTSLQRVDTSVCDALSRSVYDHRNINIDNYRPITTFLVSTICIPRLTV